MHSVKRILLAYVLSVVLLSSVFTPAKAETTQEEEACRIDAPCAVLMEPTTGRLIYEKEKDTRRSPASITKIMTLLLIYDAEAAGSIHMDDEVVTSAHAKSMGGSQVFLEEGEKQTVETLIKCIVIASGNDASVAMAEYIAGSEPEFVNAMNRRAGSLGMENTHFEDCCGLTDSQNHYTTAYDVALMSRELITKYPQILDYSGIWMEDITHVTAKGSKPFTLTNTNKLIRSFEGCVGLKTGSTSTAKYCVSAVAKRDGISLISVILAAPDVKARFRDAATLLRLGFGKCRLYTDENRDELPPATLSHSLEKQVRLRYAGAFHYLDTQSSDLQHIEKKLTLKEGVEAPVKEGAAAGKAVYYLDGAEIGSVDIVYAQSVPRADYLDYLNQAIGLYGC